VNGSSLYISDSSMDLHNNIFIFNNASEYGGIFGKNSSLLLSESYFMSNEAELNGSVLYLDASSTLKPNSLDIRIMDKKTSSQIVCPNCSLACPSLRHNCTDCRDVCVVYVSNVSLNVQCLDYQKNDCKNGGTCNNYVDGTLTCSCINPYSGLNCQLQPTKVNLIVIIPSISIGALIVSIIIFFAVRKIVIWKRTRDGYYDIIGPFPDDPTYE